MSSDAGAEELLRPLAEPYAFALITWPAAALALRLAAAGEQGWAIAAVSWLTLFAVAAYRRGAGFGNVMLLTNAAVAWASTAYPSPWAFAAFPLLLIGLHGAQRALLRRRAQLPEVPRDEPKQDTLSE